MIRKKNGENWSSVTSLMLQCWLNSKSYEYIPLHYHVAKAHLQPKQEFFYFLVQEEEDQAVVAAGILLFSLPGASAYCRRASFAQVGHKMQMEKSAIK